MKVFVDTNILIDYLCRREPFFLSAKAVFASCFLGKNEGFVSSLSVVNSIVYREKVWDEAVEIEVGRFVSNNQGRGFIGGSGFTNFAF